MGDLPAPVVSPPAGRWRILVADDSMVSRQLLESALTKWDYEVISVEDGAKAWEILQEADAPRLAILDWMMPGLSGPEVCRLVRKRNQPHYTYLILLTARNEKADLIEGLEAGADDYLVKPLDTNELKVRLGPGRRIIQLQNELLHVQELLREQATRDALTKLWNRHAISDILTRELSRSCREGVPLGIMMADLDRFKQVNDTYGHIAGDAVLREVAYRISNSIRPYDAAGRYGGEEFLLILPGCDAESALQTAERICDAIRRDPIVLPDLSLRMTASFGVTSLPRGAFAEPEHLIRIADEALYQAKQAGRDRCVVLPFVNVSTR
jgi:diguanylate cyclase (GGDEF)-like protein